MTAAARRRTAPRVRLVRTAVAAPAPLEPDAAQQAVIDHVATAGHGPLLVLAGPGTGKTATIVESVAARVASGTDPDRILVLTFSRKAAGELRDRITARLGAHGHGVPAWTFHAYCYALVGQVPDPDDPTGLPRPVRLLSGPEQDAVVRDLLLGHAEEGFVGWPDSLKPALTTRGFADEVRGLFAHVRGQGLDPQAIPADRAEWQAASAAMDEYLDVLDARGLLDYSELVHRAVAFATSAEGRDYLAQRYDLVVVDEYQDTDPGQERLLQMLAGQGRDLLVVGDPDQSIYAFRGADVRAILDFPERFPRSDGQPAPVRALTVCRRSGEVLVDAARRLATRLPAGGTAFTRAGRDHRSRVAAPGLDPGQVQVRTYASPGAQYDAIADDVRRAHLEDGVPWDGIAVLVRSGAASIPPVRRALAAAGVPVEVARDEVPLAHDAALTPLLLALRMVVDPASATAEDVRALLLSPLGGADPAALRRLGRVLRAEYRDGEAAASTTSGDPATDPIDAIATPSSAELIRLAVLEPERLRAHLAGRSRMDASAPARLGALLQSARELVASGATAHQVLWELWDQKPWRDQRLPTWGERLERAAFAGGPQGRRADRDLDAVVALFDLAARADERAAKGGVRTFLEVVASQEIPADTLAERGLRGAAVRVLTAHRSKGLEWDVVVVADVHEDSWPDLRRRGSVLRADEIGTDTTAGITALLAEERRLFYVACTRARRTLLVTAVASPAEDGARPSRFIDELGVPVTAVTDRPRRPLSLTPLVADLRRALEDPTSSAPLRAAAAERLAELARMEHEGLRLVPAADPDRWWGALERTASTQPLFPDDEPLRLSGSSLDALTGCALAWFLAHEANGEPARTGAVGFGSVIHALADDLARREGDADLDVMRKRLDQVWSSLDFEARWQSRRERQAADDALVRLLHWHVDPARADRTLVGSEVRFEVEIGVGGRPVVLRGSMDRVEIDDDGAVVVVDLKTMKKSVTKPALTEHVQLGVYQLAVREGALDNHPKVSSGVTPGGAELVQLRLDAKGGVGGPLVQGQDALGDDRPTWIDDIMAAGVERLVSEDFAPDPVNGGCQFCPFTACCPAQDEGRTVL